MLYEKVHYPVEHVEIWSHFHWINQNPAGTNCCLLNISLAAC